jgi:hypothetical protein
MKNNILKNRKKRLIPLWSQFFQLSFRNEIFLFILNKAKTGTRVASPVSVVVSCEGLSALYSL